MCGFFWNYKKLRKNIIEIKELKSDLQRRGPDKFKFIEKQNFSIFFSRLSIDRNERSTSHLQIKKKDIILYLMVRSIIIYK